MQSNTDRSCLLIPFTSAPNTWQNRNQVLPHAGHADPLAIGVKKSVHFQLYRSTRLLPGHSTSSKCSHYIIRRLSKPEFCLWTTITIRVEMTPLMTESRSDYQHTSILTHSNSTTQQQSRSDNKPLTLSSNNLKKNCYCRFHRMCMFSDTAVLVKIPSE